MKMSECFTLPVACIYDEDGVPFQIVDPYNDLVIDGEDTFEEINFDAVAMAINNHDALVDALRTINVLSEAGADVDAYLDDHVVPLLAKLDGE